jgi:hypothetical protein
VPQVYSFTEHLPGSPFDPHIDNPNWDNYTPPALKAILGLLEKLKIDSVGKKTLGHLKSATAVVLSEKGVPGIL